MFSEACVKLFCSPEGGCLLLPTMGCLGPGGICLGVTLSGGLSVQRGGSLSRMVTVQGCLCPGGLCLGLSLCPECRPPPPGWSLFVGTF